MGPLSDLHTHSRFCDGSGDLSEYVESALAAGLQAIGLSGHAPCVLASDWHMPASLLAEYLSRGRELSCSYAGRIEVLVGLEADFVPGVISPAEVRAECGLDYVIGGVHYLGCFADGTPWTVDGPAEEMERGVRESFGGDARAAATRYFQLVAAMADGPGPDVVAHLDLIRINNRGLFDEEAAWYRTAAEEALAAVASAGCVVEINTGAVSRGKASRFYPSDAILASMAQRGIPVTLGSDAHSPTHVAAHFSAALDALARAGYREVWVRARDGWRSAALEPHRGG